MTEDELRNFCDKDGRVGETAREFIRSLYKHIETSKVEDAASSIAVEGTPEVELLQSEKQQLLIEKDREIEWLEREASELHKSKRQLMELLEQKDMEVGEKNTTIKSYLDKIELLERHNSLLNEELTAKADSLIQLRKENGELEAEMSAKLGDVEKRFKESSSSLKLQKDKSEGVGGETGICGENELLSTKGAAAAAEEGFSSEISTVTKLVDLYKEISEEWSKKAGKLEGVIKALETHLNRVESDYKDKLEKEVSARKEVEKVLYQIKEKAGVIMDEREEHESFAEPNSSLDQKLQRTLSKHTALEITIQALKATLKRQERDYAVAQKDIVDLAKQVYKRST